MAKLEIHLDAENEDWLPSKRKSQGKTAMSRELRDFQDALIVKKVVARVASVPSSLKPGTRVRVLPSHGLTHWHGDVGTIEKYIPFGKFYVQLEKNGRHVVPQEDLEEVK
jgi:hypothetical protein